MSTNRNDAPSHDPVSDAPVAAAAPIAVGLLGEGELSALLAAIRAPVPSRDGASFYFLDHVGGEPAHRVPANAPLDVNLIRRGLSDPAGTDERPAARLA